MNRVRILAMVEPHSLSGSAKAVVEFAREAAREYPEVPKIDLSILTFERAQGESALRKVFRDLAIPVDVILERGRFDTNVISQLRAASEKRRAEVVWSNSVKSHFLVRYARLNQSMRWVAFHHGYTTTDLKMRIYNQLDGWSLPRADHVLTSAAAFVEELVQKKVLRQKIHVQHMPVRPFTPVPEIKKKELRDRMGFDDRARVLLCVGRLSHEKGQTDLVRAFPKIRELVGDSLIRMVLVGDGPERPRIEGLCRRLHLSDVVVLAGQQNDVDPYYGIADVLLLPSLSEGCPNVLLEAMAAGVPVIATEVGGVPEVATSGRDAILVGKHDMSALASATAELLKDQGLRHRLSSCAREIVLRKTPQAFFKSIASVFGKVLTDVE
jgi:glycosyltransferase involved in cell wall biosynthesis